jgi:nitrilase
MTSGPDVTVNLEQARGLLEDVVAQGAGLAVLPENFAFMGLHDADKRAVGESDGSGPIQDFLSSTALKLRVTIVAGTIPLRAGADGRVAAASLVYGPDGKRVGRYDKIHLFDVDIPSGAGVESGGTGRYRESAHVAPGVDAVVVETAAGKLGLSVCYDVRFPELYRSLSASGAQLLSIPSAFTSPTGRAHWETLLRARAIENLCYVIAPAQSGFHPSGRETYGDTMIVDPWGRVLQRLPRGRGSVLADIDLNAQAEVRRNFPALQHRVFAATHS